MNQYMKPASLLALFAMATTVSVLTMAVPRKAAAQANPTIKNMVPESEAVVGQATITAINTDTRAVALVGASGHKLMVVAGPDVRLPMLKVGDTVNVKYYRSVGFVVVPPQGGNAAPVSDDQVTQVIAQPAETPGGVGLRLTKVSGTVISVDMSSHSIDVVNPSGGGVYTIDVTDPARILMLGSLKIGDTITAVVSEALAVSIEPAPKHWF